MIAPEQLRRLRALQAESGATVGELIRRAIDRSLGEGATRKAERKRAATRKRS